MTYSDELISNMNGMGTCSAIGVLSLCIAGGVLPNDVEAGFNFYVEPPSIYHEHISPTVGTQLPSFSESHQYDDFVANLPKKHRVNVKVRSIRKMEFCTSLLD
ncbi:MAG: hypothetical protein GXP22_05415 [Gammaproteobacteria bacterium]|nr:hypothetical protein [Gammaproteobacteria bacterium]